MDRLKTRRLTSSKTITQMEIQSCNDPQQVVLAKKMEMADEISKGVREYIRFEEVK